MVFADATAVHIAVSISFPPRLTYYLIKSNR